MSHETVEDAVEDGEPLFCYVERNGASKVRGPGVATVYRQFGPLVKVWNALEKVKVAFDVRTKQVEVCSAEVVGASRTAQDLEAFVSERYAVVVFKAVEQLFVRTGCHHVGLIGKSILLESGPLGHKEFRFRSVELQIRAQ
jgi:class 3 adenylate cyclase